ncbi:hypothetical protein SEA_NUEVOMUNDO_21 [Mycobacterium phage NuevoMundo]|uniref:Uncharacterized protein n=2 Tax=Bixzunavirus TaxID=680114 RepID=A0A411CCH7_9CAUD|nr:hypothetical protein KHO58_gp022 [Mycobacterium phage Bigswole]YP_010057890.1 hypothetical protein KHO62_gp016 [Mycobacterium phage NoodleTree]AVJ48299.1 hypothetical protein SEA_NUEVOMUNDO_21 [Mycobacterium phage NuevoMundo]UTN92508.1 hypothetical protein SEA_MIKRO_16 [Mycobacterium phage Mikro]ATN87701.1 hypothetical protein SEA_BIGSWOLE_22 [Mycobacterium phage Bigswole]QAY11565.1 hypothetical protein SEA_NOODLETREE_16 [Mycobacterium phage NoodleTree]
MSMQLTLQIDRGRIVEADVRRVVSRSNGMHVYRWSCGEPEVHRHLGGTVEHYEPDGAVMLAKRVLDSYLDQAQGLRQLTNDELRAVLTETLSEVLKRLWPAPEDAADQADWDALPGKLADVIVSLPARQVRQWLLTLRAAGEGSTDGDPRSVAFEALMGAAEDRAVQCVRCGNAASRHGERPQDSPPGCGWTYSMVVRAAGEES